ncbi:hypothetical protein ACFRFH_12065 [Leifsonia sp. NPDC056824]|uniref:DUF7455 domain-containing protein n=1 Tax=Leifsonia sp. NPDC056824 TaxID=3345953 RepID=UPI00367386A5
MTLAPAPSHPVEDVRIIEHADQCDDHCGAQAYVRVYIYVDRDKDQLRGVLHFCAHHWRDHADKLYTMALDGSCGILDERHWLTS